MQNGDFSEDDIAQTKAVIKNQVLETIDTAYGLAEFLYQQASAQVEIPIETFLDNIEKVTKEDVLFCHFLDIVEESFDRYLHLGWSLLIQKFR